MLALPKATRTTFDLYIVEGIGWHKGRERLSAEADRGRTSLRHERNGQEGPSEAKERPPDRRAGGREVTAE